MGYFNKKFIILIFFALTLFSALPKTANAGLLDSIFGGGGGGAAIQPVLLVNPDLIVSINATAVNTGITAGATSATIAEISFEWAFKLLAETLKRQLLNMIVDQIVTYIQGGGEPKFITDWPGFFRDAVDQAGGKFLQQIGLSQLCSPFKPLLSAAFIPIPTFAERTSCTLNQVGVNIDVFLKDFRQGNWIAWQEMVLRPQNNVYGAYVMAWDQYEIEKSAAAKAAESEAQAGKGFLSVRKCLESVTDPGDGSVTCTKSIIVTPGSVVGDLAAKAVGSDIDYIVNAQDFEAYVSAIANAILNRIFAEGIGLLHTALSSEGEGEGGGGGGSSAHVQCAQLLGTAAYNDCITAMQSGSDIREFQKNYLISLIDQDLAYQNQLLGAKQATLIILNQSIDILTQLENCQGSTPSELSQVQSAASTVASQIIQIQSDIIALQVKQQEIIAVIDLSQIPPLYNQVAGIVKSSITLSLAFAAQNETGQKQQDMSLYQQQLTSCQAAAAGG